jgi:hypothetical protein
MAKDETRSLSDSTLLRDRNAVVSVAKITGYAPANADCTVTNLQASQTAMISAQNAEVEANNALAAAADNARKAEWDFHNLVLAAKDQVRAQFGNDSNEVQSIGLKKKSEYKNRSRKKSAPAS